MSSTGDHQSWMRPGPILHLEPGLVDVWFASYDPADVEGLGREILTAEDVARADRFRFARDRERWLHARLVVRDTLSRYIGVSPRSIHFEANRSGKPRLHDARHGADPRFNLSHAGDYTLVALSLGAEVGVDVEWISRRTDIEAIARRFFTPAEREQLDETPEALRREAFFECWTRKEAFLKAKGTGLQLPLTGFDVAFGPGREAAVLRTDWDPADAGRWTLAGLRPAPDVVGAVAVEGAGWRLRTYRWSGR